MRSLIWIDAATRQGWACSSCNWSFPLPTLLSDPEARAAYDRLAAAKFRDHKCESGNPESKASTTPDAPAVGVAERARALVRRGYKPKDAVQLVLQELELEYSAQPRYLERARQEGQEFLEKVRRGLI